MKRELISLTDRNSLTRISVSGNGNHYLVRNGNEGPVRVWVRSGALQCECGRAGCSHVASLEMCGFVEPDCEGRRAA